MQFIYNQTKYTRIQWIPWISYLPAFRNRVGEILEPQISTSFAMRSLVFDGSAGPLLGHSLGLGVGQDFGHDDGEAVLGFGGRPPLALRFDE